MALTDFLTQIADSIRSKDGTTEPIPATDFPQRILDITGGGGSDLPSNINTGTFTVAEDTTEPITIPHGCGSTPITVFIYPDNPEYLIGNIAYSFLGGTTSSVYKLVITNNKGAGEKINVFNVEIDDANITITNLNTTYKFRAGAIYRWFAWGESA